MSTDPQMIQPHSDTPAMLAGLSVVVPVYRSEAILPELVRRLEGTLPAIASSYELVLVNDSSPDGSWNVICQLAQHYRWIHAINLMRNYGQHNALLCGIRAAQYGIIVTIDDDLQHPPEEIPKLLQILEQGFDVVYGRPAQEQHGLLRDLASLTTKLALQNMMGAEIARQVSAFRVFRAEVANAFRHYDGSFVSIDVLLTWGTNRFAASPVRHEPRAKGASGYTFRKLLIHAMNMVTGFSTMPLQIASLVGFAFTLFGFAVLCYVLIRYFLQGTPVPGFPFLASIIALFSGAQLFALGIMGEYLARMHFRSMQKPPYVVRATVPTNGPGGFERGAVR
ncbi:MAG TPA: glycosyltransferase family 2 protein [Candidatus Sulfotelmatobacter sp.]|jgi:glycosyltransferase involved in cell wall biosynthesis|nr:glycosyltransferase family 2 protein [Candidatus Sulfotelmatobacter sp.]